MRIDPSIDSEQLDALRAVQAAKRFQVTDRPQQPTQSAGGRLVLQIAAGVVLGWVVISAIKMMAAAMALSALSDRIH